MKTSYLFATAATLLGIVAIDGIINGFTPITGAGSIATATILATVAYRKARR